MMELASLATIAVPPPRAAETWFRTSSRSEPDPNPPGATTSYVNGASVPAFAQVARVAFQRGFGGWPATDCHQLERRNVNRPSRSTRRSDPASLSTDVYASSRRFRANVELAWWTVPESSNPVPITA